MDFRVNLLITDVSISMMVVVMMSVLGKRGMFITVKPLPLWVHAPIGFVGVCHFHVLIVESFPFRFLSKGCSFCCLLTVKPLPLGVHVTILMIWVSVLHIGILINGVLSLPLYVLSKGSFCCLLTVKPLPFWVSNTINRVSLVFAHPPWVNKSLSNIFLSLNKIRWVLWFIKPLP